MLVSLFDEAPGSVGADALAMMSLSLVSTMLPELSIIVITAV